MKRLTQKIVKRYPVKTMEQERYVCEIGARKENIFCSSVTEYQSFTRSLADEKGEIY